MIIVTQRDKIKSLAKRWAGHNATLTIKDGRPALVFHSRIKEDVYKSICQSDLETVSTAEVLKLLEPYGPLHRMWVVLYCCECHKEVDTVVRFGEPDPQPCEEAESADVCLVCLKAVADRLLKENHETETTGHR